MAKKNFYDVLQVSPNADPEIIKAAYRSLCQRHHPDKNPGNPEADKLIKIINRAYEVLSDPVKRAGYDAALADIDEEQHEKPGDTTFTQNPVARKDRTDGINSRSQHSVPENDSPTSPHPWIRFGARFVDYGVWGVTCSLIIFAFSRAGIISDQILLFLDNPVGLSVLLVILWALIEPIVLKVFGTTVGRALMNIKLTNHYNDNIVHMPLQALYLRSMAVLIKGLAFGLPIFWWITAFNSYVSLKKHGETSWDRNGGFVVNHGKLGYVKGVFAISIVSVTILASMIAHNLQMNRYTQRSTFVPDSPADRREAARQSQPSSGKSGGYGVNDIVVEGTAQQSQPSTGLFDDVLNTPTDSREAAAQIQQPTTYLSTDPNAGLNGAARQNQRSVASSGFFDAFTTKTSKDWLKLGASHYDAGRNAQSIDAFLHALEIEPNNTIALNNLGFVYNKVGRKSEVIKIYQKLKELNPDMAASFYQLHLE